MPRKLRKDSLMAELSSVRALLEESIAIGDPVGQIQFNHRKEEILGQLNELDESFDTLASLAIYFGGKPVIGSRGISAEFASIAIEELQSLISKVQASNLLGKIGERGRVPKVTNSELMITEVTKGSFGFVLEELSDQQPLFETALKATVDQVSNIIAKTCAPNEEEFEEILDQIDSRSLISLKKFLANLDNNKATLRLVENNNDFIIDEDSAHRGRVRIETTVIEEEYSPYEGKLVGFLPEHKKFELKLKDGELIYGTATVEATEQYTSLTKQGISIINNFWIVNLEVRNIKPLNRPEKTVYKLVEFIKQIDENA